jgi:hypothetical protein
MQWRKEWRSNHPTPGPTTHSDEAIQKILNVLNDPESTNEDKNRARLTFAPQAVSLDNLYKMWIPAPELTTTFNEAEILQSIGSDKQPLLWTNNKINFRDFTVIKGAGIRFFCSSQKACVEISKISLNICGKSFKIANFSKFNKLYYIDLHKIPENVSDQEILNFFVDTLKTPVLSISPKYGNGSIPSSARRLTFTTYQIPKNIYPDGVPLREVFLNSKYPTFIQHRNNDFNQVIPPSIVAKRIMRKIEPKINKNKTEEIPIDCEVDTDMVDDTPHHELPEAQNTDDPMGEIQPVQDDKNSTNKNATNNELCSSLLQNIQKENNNKPNTSEEALLDDNQDMVDSLLPEKMQPDRALVELNESKLTVNVSELNQLDNILVATPHWKLVQYSTKTFLKTNKENDDKKMKSNIVRCEVMMEKKVCRYSVTTYNIYEELITQDNHLDLIPDIDIFIENGKNRPSKNFTLKNYDKIKKAHISFDINQIDIDQLKSIIDEEIEKWKNTADPETYLTQLQANPSMYRSLCKYDQSSIQIIYNKVPSHTLHRLVSTNMKENDGPQSFSNKFTLVQKTYPQCRNYEEIIKQILLEDELLIQWNYDISLWDLLFQICAPNIYFNSAKLATIIRKPVEQLLYNDFVLLSNETLIDSSNSFIGHAVGNFMNINIDQVICRIQNSTNNNSKILF